MKITFCGAVESVTGSCHLIEAEGGGVSGRQDAAPTDAGRQAFLLDCGQYQGSARQEAKNFEPFPFEPEKVDFLILSHAHVDHCGRIPLLVKQGFRGPIYCTAPTADLLPIMLRDCAHIHEKEAEWKTKKGQRTGQAPVAPLFTTADAEAALAFITPVLYDQEVAPAEGVRFSFVDAGHILGSAITEIWLREAAGEVKLVYSGDLGVDTMPMLRDPVRVRQTDVLIMETTYGGRVRERIEPSLTKLADIIERTTKRGGTVLIPSFAVGRTQELIYELNRFYDGKGDAGAGFRDVMVYVDSPMATAATEAFRKNSQDFDDEYKAFVMSGDDPLDFANLVFTQSTEESKALNADMGPKIILSASGMCEAGRILHHLKHRLWDPKSTIVFVGYQAEGTLGRRLIDGAKTVSVLGEAVDVNADIISLEGFSAHADRDGLLDWVRGFDTPPDAIFLVHGEAKSKARFAETLKEEVGLESIVVDEYCTYQYLRGDGALDNRTARPENFRPGFQGAENLSEISGCLPQKTDPRHLYSGEGSFGSKEDSRHVVEPEEMERLLSKLRNINDNVEGLLYRAKLAAVEAADAGDADKYTALKNVIASLDAGTVKLAGALADTRGSLGGTKGGQD